jgi:hypothetical protein
VSRDVRAAGAHRRAVETQDRGHRADADRNRLHRLRAKAHQRQRIGKAQRACDDERRTAERVAGDDRRRGVRLRGQAR